MTDTKKTMENTEVKEVMKEKKERKTLKQRGEAFVEKHPRITSGVKTVGKVLLKGVQITGEAALVTVGALATLATINKLTGAVDVIDCDSYTEITDTDDIPDEEAVTDEPEE